jgi:hypothetical protein
MADCEQLHDGLLAEPVNALSSLAYVAAGVYVFRHHSRVQGSALVAVGAGSVTYHGFGGGFAHFLHDASIVVVAGAVAATLPRIGRGARRRPRYAAQALGGFALALPLQLFGRTGGPLCDPRSVFQMHAGWHVLTAAAIGAAFVLAHAADEPPAARGAANPAPTCVPVARNACHRDAGSGVGARAPGPSGPW